VQAPPEQPPDVSQQQNFTPDQPQISAPTVSAITSTTTTATSFTMTTAPVPVMKPMGDVKMSTDIPKSLGTGIAKGLPSTMAGRAGGTARGRIQPGGRSRRGADRSRHGGLGALHDSDPTRAEETYEYDPLTGHDAAANLPEWHGRPLPLANWCVAFNMPVPD
jgi:hypothetical protein